MNVMSENLMETLYKKKIDGLNILNIEDAKNLKKEWEKKNSSTDNFANKVVFITGVTGQDGSHMVDYLLNNTKALIFGGVRRLSVNNHSNINHISSSRFHLVNFDLTDAHAISSIVEKLKPDYFVNFAAQSFVASSWDFARQTWQTNSTAVLDILEAIRQYKPTCRFYNAGSSEEFGNVSYSPQDENHPLRPRSPYGASKAAARQIVKVYRDSYDLYAIQGWLFNHEGPRRGEEFVTRKITKGVARIVYSIKNQISFLPIELGNIYAKRDWSDSEDFMECVWMMLNQEKFRVNFNETKKLNEYVLSSNQSHTIKEFIEKAFITAGIEGVWHGESLLEEYGFTTKSAHELNIPSSVLVKIHTNFYRPAEVDLLLGNSDKFRNYFNWIPKTSFEQLVEKMVHHDLKQIGL